MMEILAIPRRHDAGEAARGPGPLVVACESIAGAIVLGAGGEELGRLEHVMLDVRRGRLAYGVLAHGGVFGLGARLFAVPWEAFALDAARHCLVLGIDRETLERSPGFDDTRWPPMGDAGWAARVHEYFGLAPYWLRDAPR
jgi:hypothetical protein